MASVTRVTTSAGDVRFRVRWRTSDGRTVEEWRRTATAARQLQREKEREADDGVVLDPRAGKRTLDDYFTAWMTTRLVKGRPLTMGTRLGYEGLYRRNIAKPLGARQLRSLRPETVRTWHAEVTAFAGADQAAKSYRLLRAVLATAEADELIRQNPCRIRGGGEEHAEERPMVPTSLVLELASVMDGRYKAMVMLAGFVGLRTGETLGLERRDVDLLHSEIHVERQAQQLAGVGRVVIPPKSEAGRRVVAVPGVVIAALTAHLAAYTGTEPESPVFTAPEGGPMRRAAWSTAWRSAVEATGAPANLRPHDLRHHAATLTARMPGITTKELMARIGHASPRAALVYQHATRDRDRAIASYLDEVVSQAQPEKSAPVVSIAP